MTLAPGDRLGAYEIIALLGRGGMGEVYRAHDTRLGRDVAIKTLASVSISAERLRHFQQEARASASLDHPNIVVIHDVGRHEDAPYLVMELLDGETLQARLGRGAMPWRKALEIAAAIAEGLSAAHTRGIVHCDIKPANVFLTRDERVKLLDFGVAKLREGPASTDTPTQTDIEAGATIGTAGYMSPEQVAARPVDARADLFALGCVMYEMVTGRRPFGRPTGAESMAAILNDEPLPIESAPFTLRRVIAQCLEKSPDRRFQSAHDVSLVLAALTDSDQPPAAAPAPETPPRRWLAATVVLSAIAAGAITFGVASYRLAGNSGLVVRSAVLPPDNMALYFTAGPMALSPDGRHLAFVAVRNGQTGLWVRPLDGVGQLLAGTEGARRPFWSPDGRRIGFFSKGGVRIINAAGGFVEDPCNSKTNRAELSIGNGWGAAWSHNGTIVFNPHRNAPLYAVAATGGPCTPITTLNTSEADIGHRAPSFLPDGRRFLFHVESTKAERTGIYLGSLDSPEVSFVVHTSHRGIYRSGHLLFVRQNVLVASAFDDRQGRLNGDPIVLSDPLAMTDPVPEPLFSASENGLLSYIAAHESEGAQLEWIDRSGRELGLLPIFGTAPRLSHDGKRVAVEVPEPPSDNSDIWVHDLDRMMGIPLTAHAARDYLPRWSPDDKSLVFASNRRGKSSDIYLIDAAGAGTEELLLASPGGEDVTSWSSDGKYLIYNTGGRNGGQELWRLTLPQKTASPLFTAPQSGSGGEISPDGRWIAFVSNETGRNEVWVRGIPPQTEKHRASNGGGYMARWRADGRELFYIEQPTSRLMAVSVKSGSTVELGTPVALFERPYLLGPSYDVTPDGQRFIVRRRGELANHITLIQNWTEILRKAQSGK